MTEPSDRIEQLARDSAALSPCPPPEQLAAYLLQLLDGPEQLSVDAHLRRCPLCASDAALGRPPELSTKWQLAADRPRSRPLLARLVAAAAPAVSLRGEARPGPRRYESAALSVDLTIDRTGDFRRLTGQVLHGPEGVADCMVVLRAGRRRYSLTSDDAGYFTFEDLPPGHYRLLADDGRVRVEIPDLDLSAE